MKKFPLVVGLSAIALVASIGLSACGSSTSTAGAKSGAGQKVTFWGSWSSPEQVAQLKQQTAAFNKAQTKYQVTYVPQEMVEAKLLTGLASGQCPTL